MLTFVKDLVNTVDIDNGNYRIGLVAYNTKVTTSFTLDAHLSKASLNKAVDNIPYKYGNTNTADGIKFVLDRIFSQKGDRLNVPNIAIMITDGLPNMNVMQTVPEAKRLKDSRTRFYIIGIGKLRGFPMEEMASEPMEDNGFFLDSFEDMLLVRNKIFSGICKGIPCTNNTNVAQSLIWCRHLIN